MKALFYIILSILTFSFKSYSQDLNSLEQKLNQKINEKLVIDEVFEVFDLKNKYNNIERSNGVFLMKIFESKSFSPEVLESFEKYKLNKAVINDFKNLFQAPSYGTGFLYKGYVVTNFHVCRGQNVLAKDYEGDIISLKVLKFNPTQDICILKMKSNKKYFDFSSLIKKEERGVSSIKNNVLSKKDIYTIDSMFGKILSNKISKDQQSDQWKKENAYETNNLKEGECRGGISGSPVYSNQGFFGIAWGSTVNEDDKDMQRCYIVEKNSIDELINSL